MRLLTCVALLSLAGAGALAASTAPVRAEEWCGFHDKAGAQVRCGYSSLDECKHKLGDKNTVCLPSPSFASDGRRRAITFRNG
jgi:hypothetical protein